MTFNFISDHNIYLLFSTHDAWAWISDSTCETDAGLTTSTIFLANKRKCLNFLTLVWVCLASAYYFPSGSITLRLVYINLFISPFYDVFKSLMHLLSIGWWFFTRYITCITSFSRPYNNLTWKGFPFSIQRFTWRIHMCYINL